MIVSGSWLMAFAMVAGRVAGLFTFAPFFADVSIPVRAKAGMVLLLTALIVPISGVHPNAVGLSEALMATLHSCMIGLLLGLSATLVFEAVRFAGQIIGVQLGLSLVTVLDPQTQADSPVISIFLQTLLMLLFLSLNVHHWLMRALVNSFSLLPMGGVHASFALVGEVTHDFAGCFLLGIEIAFPVLAVTLLADVSIAFLSKASPQLPVLLVSMPVKLVLGVGALSAAIRYWPALFDRQFAIAVSTAERWLVAAR